MNGNSKLFQVLSVRHFDRLSAGYELVEGLRKNFQQSVNP